MNNYLNQPEGYPTLKERIQKAHEENPTLGHFALSKIVGCANNTVKYHLNDDTKQKVIARRNETRQRALNNLKNEFSGKCSVCNYNRCLRNLHFHHLDPKQKAFGLSDTGWPIEKLRLEAAKCVLVCANCHGEIHEGLITI